MRHGCLGLAVTSWIIWSMFHKPAHGRSLYRDLGLLGRAKIGLQWLLTRRGLGATNHFEAGASFSDAQSPGRTSSSLPASCDAVRWQR